MAQHLRRLDALPEDLGSIPVHAGQLTTDCNFYLWRSSGLPGHQAHVCYKDIDVGKTHVHKKESKKKRRKDKRKRKSLKTVKFVHIN